MTTIAERVAAGAAFLDEHDPQWWRADVEWAIDLDELDLESPQSCVLGQRCPFEVFSNSGHFTYYEAFGEHLTGLKVNGMSDLDDWAVPLGFQAGNDIGEDGDTDEFAELTREWKRVIAERRAA